MGISESALVLGKLPLVNKLIGFMKSVRENFHNRILLGIVIAITLAFFSSVYALHYLRSLHQEFIGVSRKIWKQSC